VDLYASSVVENIPYSLVPEIFGGTNSNGIATAIEFELNGSATERSTAPA